ncbi:jg13345 [Pararge aegeria aegeria]|uniref:Jg13345 protein n=1 Tax=Pararge aegeria aegeria TaxID=348720 RepID=A0A8S4SB39_9NEOP|nr:jg13345 [Pararge aegeria aegeria]
MANVRDSDTSLWLHNKLGTSNDSWTTGSICTQLNAEVLKNIKDCFPDLQTQVKLKLLLSFFHIPRRNVEEWKNELEEIIEVAGVDSDLWVAMLAEVLKTFPSAGTLNTEIAEFDETRPIFSDMIAELRRALAKHSDLGLLPLECLYLNKNALVSVPASSNPSKHFISNRVIQMWNALPEDVVTAESLDQFKNRLDKHEKDKERKKLYRRISESCLVYYIIIIIIISMYLTAASTESVPETAEPTNEVENPPSPAPAQPAPPILVQQGTGAKPIVIGQQQKLIIAGQAGGKPVLLSAQNLLNTSAVILQGGGKAVLLQNIKPMSQQVVQQTPQPAIQHQIAHPQPVQQVPVAAVQPQAQPQPQTQPQPQPQTPAQPQQATQPLLPRRGLSLTREQMMEAQDMFRNANRVTRPEKALILGFMAGSRDNPCPNLGNIVTIKLSENIENVLQSDDTYLTMLSEMHFQMNYNNGQWTRLKKYRHIDGMVPQKIPPGSTVIAANNQQPVVSIANQSVS